jgi:bifunctional DNase/RNase
MEKIKLEIVAISHSVTSSHNYAVILGENEGKRRLPIVIGGFEAQAIAVAVEKMTPNRPLTHDLFKNTLHNFEISVAEIVINDLIDGIFYAQLTCVQAGNTFIIDSRTSDAIAMAVRFDCPIYTYEFIMEAAGVDVENDESEKGEIKVERKSKKGNGDITTLSTSQLETMLQNVLEAEDYEKAAQIRDELNRRSA